MRVLHAIHDFLPGHAAGSEIYAFHLCRELSRRHQVHVLAAEYDPDRPHGSLAWRSHRGLPVTELVNNWRFASFEESYRSPELGGQLDHVLASVQPDVLHLHSLLNLSFDLPRLARARGIPSVATLHDYTLVCPSGGQRLHRDAEHLCVEVEPQRCARCFGESPFHAQMVMARAGLGGSRPALARIARSARRAFPRLAARVGREIGRAPVAGVTAAGIERRLAAAREVLGEVDVFVAPSRALGEEFLRLGLPARRLRIADYGFPPASAGADPPPGDRLRLGFVGTLVWHKGVHVLIEAVRALPPDRFELLVFGDPGTFPDYAARLRELASGLPVVFAGAFDPEAASDVYRRFDVLVVPSLWLENSPLVIHEAFRAGRPVIGARIGGIPGLIDEGRSGLLYDPRSPSDLARVLLSLIESPERWTALKTGLPALRSIDADARAWEEIYTSVLDRPRPLAPETPS